VKAKEGLGRRLLAGGVDAQRFDAAIALGKNAKNRSKDAGGAAFQGEVTPCSG
jgi:hypothetical protein